jgi:enoyl-CoA hydratase
LSDFIQLRTEGPVATVTLSRPAQRNAINYDMWLELRKVARRLADDHDVHCVVFRGAGEDFSSGADIKDFPAHRYDSKSARNYAAAFEGALDLIEGLPQPTISMIRGYCVGGGLELATCTDIRIAAEGSKFGVPTAKIGIVAGFKEVRRMVNIMGPGASAYLLMSGRLIGHGEALQSRLVTLVLQDSDLEAETHRLAGEVARGAPLSHGGHKTIIRKVLNDPGLQTLTPSELAIQFDIFNSSDFLEGVKAFGEKRRPKFAGH